MSMGEKILKLRKARGWSQEELAEQIDVTRQAISRWESDSAKPDADNIVAICTLFGVSADYLLCTESSELTTFSGERTLSSDRPGLYRLVVGVIFMVLATLMLFVLVLISAIDPWVYSDGRYSYDGVAGYVLAHDMQWMVVCIVLLFFGGLALLLWKYAVNIRNKIADIMRK